MGPYREPPLTAHVEPHARCAYCDAVIIPERDGLAVYAMREHLKRCRG